MDRIEIEFFTDEPLYDGACYPKRLPYEEGYKYFVAPSFHVYEEVSVRDDIYEDDYIVKGTLDYENSTGLIKIPESEFIDGLSFAIQDSDIFLDIEEIEMYCCGQSIYFDEKVGDNLYNFTVISDIQDHTFEYTVTGQWLPPKRFKHLTESRMNYFLNEGDVVSFMDYKRKRDGIETEDIETEVEEIINPNEIHVHIDDVTIEWAEGPINDTRFNFGKPMPYKEAQELLNEQDYIAWNVDKIQGGYDKVGYIANITVNGEPDTYEGRIDLGDGKYGPEPVSIKHNMQHFLSKHFEGKKVIIDNPDVDYPVAKYMQKYGSRKENMEKFVKEHTKEIPQGTDYSKKSLDEIAVGDIFVYNDYRLFPSFFKVRRRTPSSIWVDYLESERIENPVIQKNKYANSIDGIDYEEFIVPTDKVKDYSSSWINTDKPFKLKSGYSGGVYATQGREHISAWNGKPKHIN